MPTTYAIPNGRTVMDATTYTGNGASPRTIANQYGFQPDFVWVKNRTAAGNYHRLQNSVIGANKMLFSNSTDSEQTNEINGYLSAFTSSGFTLAAGTNSSSGTNSNGDNFVAWQWQAGQGTTSSNTNGSITSTVSANATAGFSIVTYTGTGSAATVGHGLGVAPSFMIFKSRTSSTWNWQVYHASLGNANALLLNTTAAAGSYGSWNTTSPTSTVFSIGGVNGVNTNGDNMVAYCWAQVAGFSAFGSYTGNGSYGGPFVYTGFRPKFVMLKMTSSTNPWQMYDSSRDPYNYSYHILAANSSAAEDSSSGAGVAIDLLSNGFKIRTDWADINTNGGSYIYMAWAENPFKYATAR